MYSGLKEYFELFGWEAITVSEVGLQGAKDRDIVLYAKKNDFILVTQDQRMADMAEIIQAKYVLVSSGLIAKIVDEKIREKYPETRDFSGK